MNDRLEEWEEFGVGVISGKIRGFKASFLRLTLLGLSQIYRAVVATRVWLFERGVKRTHSLGCPVVSIGNLTVGGTGKTPVAELLAGLLRDHGRRVAILSRGYRSEESDAAEKPAKSGKRYAQDCDNSPPPRVVSDGAQVFLPARISGDEPNMLARNLDNVCVVVDRDRVKSGRHAIRELGCDLLMLDDGFQYMRLQRRMNFVLVDSTRPFDNGHLLPRGLLREAPRQLRRADCVFLTKCDGSPQDALRGLIRKHNPSAPVIECRHKPISLVGLYGAKTRPVEYLSGKHIAAMCGIARPEAFIDSLEALGATNVIGKAFPDHHLYTEEDLRVFADRCVRRAVDFIVTTEKDFVKFPENFQCPVPIYYLRIEIDILKGRELLDALIRSLSETREMPAVPRFL